MTTPHRGLRRVRRGSATIEFALVLNAFVVFILGTIIDWSWYFWQASLVQTALWEAAHQGAAVDLNLDCPDAVAEDKLDTMLSTYGISGATISAELESADYGVGPPTTIDQLNLGVAVDFQPILGLVRTPDRLGGAVTVPLEQQTGIGGC